MRDFIRIIPDGWDLVVLARRPIVDAEYGQIQAGLQTLLRKAGLLVKDYDK